MGKASIVSSPRCNCRKHRHCGHGVQDADKNTSFDMFLGVASYVGGRVLWSLILQRGRVMGRLQRMQGAVWECPSRKTKKPQLILCSGNEKRCRRKWPGHWLQAGLTLKLNFLVPLSQLRASHLILASYLYLSLLTLAFCSLQVPFAACLASRSQ